MKKVLLIVVLLASVIASFQAQSLYKAPFNARYSPTMTEEEMYNITFLNKMSKEDWVLFTQDPRFDAQRVIDLKTAWKQEHVPVHAMQKSLQSSGESFCTWIEPTDDYEHPNTIQWPGSPGNSTDNYSAPINLGWNFNYFGQNFNQVVLTTKGTIVLGNAGYIDFTPSAFPTPLANESNQQYDHIAGFWTDFDFGAIGELYYLVTSDALYVNYVDVGYWPTQSDKSNSFQMIITADGSDVIGGGNNVQFTYYDMQFANSQISGATGGCEATANLANVGCDRVTGTSGYQFGRFNYCNNTTWNGPYGNATNQWDGVDWLDGRVIEFNTSITNFNVNQPPVVIGEACDTITMCVGGEFPFELAFTAPESNQNVTITYTQSSSGFSTNVLNSSTTLTNSAVLDNAIFVATDANVGINTVTITATDNGSPATSTSVTYVFDVDNVVPPPMEITGVTAICAGGLTTLTASEGFDSYTWSNGDTGITADVTQQGPITVVGTYGNCSSVETINIDVTPYFIPALEGGNTPIEMCPGQTAEICVIGDYAEYEWYVYPGYDGEFVPGAPLNENCTEVTGNVNGNYAIHVTDENGCVGENIKLIQITESFVCESNADNNGAYCSALDPVDFCGFTNPAEEPLIIYGMSTNANGWQGSYINVYLYPSDGGPVEEYFYTTFASLTVFDDIIIGAGDSVAIEYFANGNNFAGNSLWVINCAQNSPDIIPAPLTSGLVWTELSTCVSSPLSGQWTVTGPTGWNMTSMTLMNSTFTPTQHGVYQLCFNDPACSIDHCYNLEYSEPPTLTISPGVDDLLCNTETVNETLNISDAAGTGTIVWTGNGVTPAANNLSAVAGPYTGYSNATITATITNVCGTSSQSFNLSHQPNVPEPTLNSGPICNGGSLLLDPIPSNQDDPNLNYFWSPGSSSNSTLTISQEGTYTVLVSNDCDASNVASGIFEEVLAPSITSVALDSAYLECETESVSLNVIYSNPSDYDVSWTGPVSSTTNTVVADEDGTYCYTVTDIYGCNMNVSDCADVNISSAPVVQEVTSELLALCPQECKQIDLVSTGEANSFSWNSSCNGYQIGSTSPTIEYCANNVPQACIGMPITITGTATNECGSDFATWYIQTNACDVVIPNIITANGDSDNDTFYIKGLENYYGAELTIYNRWGNILLETKNYTNNWNPGDLAEGTYWYFLKLPYGSNAEHHGFFTIVR